MRTEDGNIIRECIDGTQRLLDCWLISIRQAFSPLLIQDYAIFRTLRT